jgi:2-(1,2-epoxy-1,2-dihydrophenyl)acetyl-CoA isomerase
MEFETLKLEIADGAATITLNRPDRLNALSFGLLSELHRAMRLVAAGVPKREVRALLITGAGRGFCSGADLLAPRPNDPEDPKESLRDYFVPPVHILKNLGIPTIAAVNGVAAGAGMSLALSCDIVIAARSASFLAAFVNIGLVPDVGASWLLPRALGDARAAGMLLLGEKLPAEKAAEWGLIWKCVDDDQLMVEAGATLKKFAGGATMSYSRIKQLLRAAPHTALPNQIQMESEFQAVLRDSEDAQEARKAFGEKRPPMFKGR